MSIDYDQQILESTAVRRARLTKSFLFGPERTRRHFDEGLKFLLISAVLGVIISAGCIGYSFIINLFASQENGPGGLFGSVGAL